MRISMAGAARAVALAAGLAVALVGITTGSHGAVADPGGLDPGAVLAALAAEANQNADPSSAADKNVDSYCN